MEHPHSSQGEAFGSSRQQLATLVSDLAQTTLVFMCCFLIYIFIFYVYLFIYVKKNIVFAYVAHQSARQGLDREKRVMELGWLRVLLLSYTSRFFRIAPSPGFSNIYGTVLVTWDFVPLEM